MSKKFCDTNSVNLNGKQTLIKNTDEWYIQGLNKQNNYANGTRRSILPSDAFV